MPLLSTNPLAGFPDSLRNLTVVLSSQVYGNIIDAGAA